jgi:xeroderma pigmentosum group C-complementing protein
VVCGADTGQAYEESAAAAEEKALAKKEEKALKRWAKLINGLRVRKRLQAEYGEGDDVGSFRVIR